MNKCILISPSFFPVIEKKLVLMENSSGIDVYSLNDVDEIKIAVLPYSNEACFFWERFTQLDFLEIICFSDYLSIHPDFLPGDFVSPEDHISFLNYNPLIDYFKKNDVVFYDIKQFYSREKGLNEKKGVFLALDYPCLLTEAEIDFYRKTGASLINYDFLPSVMMSLAYHKELKYSGLVTAWYKNGLNELDSETLVNKLVEMIPQITL